MEKNVALIGVGIMGVGIVGNLKKLGCKLHLYTRNASKIESLKDENTFIYHNSIDAIKNSSITILCLTDDSVLRDIVLDPKFLQTVSGTVVDFGTTSHKLTMELYEEFKKIGVFFFDSPMTGSKNAAKDGQIVFMLGGGDEEYNRISKIYEVCSKKVIYCGSIGMGQIAKISLNMVQAGMLQLYMEGLMLSKKAGLDPQVYYDVIANSGANSGLAGFKLPAIIHRDFSTHFSLKNMNKDINHALQLALDNRVVLPMSYSLKSIYDAGLNHKFSEEDFSALIKINELMNKENVI